MKLSNYIYNICFQFSLSKVFFWSVSKKDIEQFSLFSLYICGLLVQHVTEMLRCRLDDIDQAGQDPLALRHLLAVSLCSASYGFGFISDFWNNCLQSSWGTDRLQTTSAYLWPTNLWNHYLDPAITPVQLSQLPRPFWTQMSKYQNEGTEKNCSQSKTYRHRHH